MHERHEIRLPRTERPGIIWSLFLFFFFVGSPLLALDNVRHWDNHIVAGISLFWLVVIAMGWLPIAEELASVLRRTIGSFSNDHFFAGESDGYVSAGFRLFGLEFLHFGLPMLDIVKVDASAGQASGLSGTDMQDWHIFVWSSDKLHTLGPEQPREAAESQVALIHEVLQRIDWTPA